MCCKDQAPPTAPPPPPPPRTEDRRAGDRSEVGGWRDWVRGRGSNLGPPPGQLRAWGSFSMLTYAQHLSIVHVVDCCFQERDAKLCTCKMGNTPPSQLQSSALDPTQTPSSRSECGIRRRLLASKVHQRPESLWTPKPMLRVEGKGSQGDTLTRSQSCCKRNSLSCFPCEYKAMFVLFWML